MKAIEIIKNLINVIGSSVGVIMVAIGSVMLLGTFLKLYVFDIQISSHFQPYNCEMIINDVMRAPNGEQIETDETPEQRDLRYEKCVARETAREQRNFINQKKHSMIDGAALIFVGLPILVFYTRRARKEK